MALQRDTSAKTHPMVTVNEYSLSRVDNVSVKFTSHKVLLCDSRAQENGKLFWLLARVCFTSRTAPKAMPGLLKLRSEEEMPGS